MVSSTELGKGFIETKTDNRHKGTCPPKGSQIKRQREAARMEQREEMEFGTE